VELFTVKRRKKVAEILETEFQAYDLGEETVGIDEALNRILSKDLVAEDNIPPFRRSTVDGYAVRSENTIGCSESLPAFLQLMGETRMGEGTDLLIGQDQTVYVPTGGIVPNGADAVCMIEHTENFDGEIAIQTPMKPLENLVDVGDDVSKGECVLKKGTRILSQHIGAIAALGIAEVPVFTKVKVSIISTGDELVAPGSPLRLGQIRDSNTDSLRAMVTSIGCEIVMVDRIKDEFESIQSALKQAIDSSDVVMISGGSSVGNHDMTPEIINSLGEPGILVHGIAIKPGKPTMLANVNGKAVFGLPGHPASCIIAYKAIVEPFIQHDLQGVVQKEFVVQATSGFQMHVSSGRDVYYMVSLEETDQGWIAMPVHGKSGMVSLLSKADGYIEIPMEKEGLEKGEQVFVKRF